MHLKQSFLKTVELVKVDDYAIKVAKEPIKSQQHANTDKPFISPNYFSELTLIAFLEEFLSSTLTVREKKTAVLKTPCVL